MKTTMFLTIIFLAVTAVVQADSGGIAKRGAIGSSSQTGLTQAQQEAYIAKIRQYQQAQAQAQAQAQNEAQPENEIRYVSQTSKYTGSPVVYTSGAAPSAHYQQQQQAIAHSQNALRQSASPQYSKIAYQTQPTQPVAPHFSLASDVSTFSYSSPVVKYSNLGLLSQLTGKQNDEQTINYQSEAPAQRTVYYQPNQPQPSPKTRVQYVPQYEAYPQQDQKSAEPAQKYVIASQKYSQSSQAVPQQRYVYVSAQGGAQGEQSSGSPQYVYQAIPQSKYQQRAYQPQPQAETSAPRSIYVRVPEQYQPQQFAQQKHGVVYAE